MINSYCNWAIVGMLALWSGCAQSPPRILRVPAVEYANRVRQGDTESRGGQAFRSPNQGAMAVAAADTARGRLQLVSNQGGGTDQTVGDIGAAGPELVTNLDEPVEGDSGYRMERSSTPDIRDYNGPLSLGDPGLSASLWRESRAGNSLYRDYRAWQPMDLITIIVSERSEGNRKAETDVKLDSTVEVGISNLFGLESRDTENRKGVDLDNLINAAASHDFSGEGETKRKGNLKATISAMVVEVLPSGVLRIEGEKILAVNNDDEVMIISGLVRPEDVNSRNEVDSSKVANMRIDFTGTGSVGDAQTGGWLGNLVRRYWPF